MTGDANVGVNRPGSRARRRAGRGLLHAVEDDAQRHPAPELRAAHGRSARAVAPRSSHGALGSAEGRPDPVELLLGQGASRVPELVPVRHGRMLNSPFAFFRGAAIVMANDLAATPSSGLRTQVCGDAHLANFGVFRTPERRMVFSLNDFDETLPGPWEWDVKRLVASVEIAARENGFGRGRAGISCCERRTPTATRCATSPSCSNLAVWYASLDVEQMMRELRARVDPARLKHHRRDIAKARTRDSLRARSSSPSPVGASPASSATRR